MGDTHQTDGKFLFYLQPIFDVWRRQALVRPSDGKVMRRVWEPDGLDICFCGGPKRFAECCRRQIPLKVNSHEIRDEIDKATTASDFARAEELSRAALAQYVIWVKQHTVPLMHVAQDLHQKLVDIDVLALEAHIELLRDSLEANGNADLFVPQMRYLASIIGVPKLSMRLVALASHWLLTAGRPEEAILELDSLGDPDKIDDAVALIAAVDILDLSPERQERLLARASAVAACEEEKWGAQLALAEHMLSRGEMEKALPIVDSIIAESNGLDRQMGPRTEALVLRWRITKVESDSQYARSAVERSQDAGLRRHYAATLIDEGMYAEAEQLLAADADTGDPIAKLLITDARIRNGNGGSARDLFLSIERGYLSHKLQYPYAVASAHLALSCKDEKIRQLAILSLRELSASGSMKKNVQDLLLALESEKFSDAAPPD